MKKLAIVTTHPIQYNAPVFKLLTERKKIQVKVFYTRSDAQHFFDQGFNLEISWDIPLLEGYAYQFQTGKKGRNPELVNAITNWAPTAILVFGWNPPGHLAVLRYFKGRILIFFRGDSNLLDETWGLKLIARRIFLKWVYQYIDLALYVGSNNKAYFLKHGLQENQLVFAPHAIDNERFQDTASHLLESEASQWRSQLGIAQNDFVILFVGKLEAKKAPAFLLDTVCKLNLSRERLVHLVFVGSGILEPQLKASAKGLSNIHFLGFQNQSKMPVAYRLGNVFCLPSVGPGETWGLAINEAMACGLPVIVSDKVGCAVDLIKEGESGYVFASRKQEDFINVLEKTIEQKSFFLGQSTIIQQQIKNWSFEHICESIESILA